MRKIKFSDYLFPRLRDIFFLAILVSVLYLGQQMLNMDGDLPRHLLTGKYIVETGVVPRTELFIYPYQGRDYVSHEWIAQVVSYLIYKVAGLGGVVFLSAILLAITFTVIYSVRSAKTRLYLPTLILVLWGAGVTSLNWVTRPHLFSMLFLAIWLGWVDKLSNGEKIPAWYFLSGIILWSNTHGEFIAGILVLAAYAAGWTWEYLFDRQNINLETGKKLFLILLISFLAGGVNPAGFEPWMTIFGFVGNDYMMARMYEARSPGLQDVGFLVFWGLLAFSALLLVFGKRRLSPQKTFLLLGFSIMSLMAARNVHLYGIVAPFALAEMLQGMESPQAIARIERRIFSVEKRLKGILFSIMLTIALLFAFFHSGTQKQYRFDSNMFPVEATEWLLENPQEGRMFNNLDWGGYLELKLWSSQLAFIDSMADTSGEVTREYEQAINLSDGWEGVLEKYNVEWVIFPTSSPLVETLKDEAWKTLYEDDVAIVLRR